MQITDAEYQIMEALWKNEPCTSSRIVEAVCEANSWSDKTIRTLINRLVSKGAIKSCKTDSKAFVYSSLISEKEYKALENRYFLNKLYGGSVKLMLASLVESKALSDDEIQNLKDILEGK